nr:AtpZ/AtpI family protein [Kordiimonas marina]
MSAAFKLGIELVAGVGIGVLIGLTLDKWLATPPVFLFVFLFLGFAAGLRNVIREAKRMQDQSDD